MSDGFKAEHFQDLFELEAGNFWFRARNRLIVWAVGRYAETSGALLEIGCGTGFVLSALVQAYPWSTVVGTERFAEGLAFARQRVPGVELVQMDARDIRAPGTFDVVGAFDVLEHITEDTEVLQQVSRVLKPDGVLVLTVPQHPWLWSAVDDYSFHVRRYTASELHAKLADAGFQVCLSTSFVTALLPVMWVSRHRNQAASFDPHAEYRLSPVLNWLLERVLGAERALIRLGIRLPVGGSRLVVARRA